jgi:hypothetical protein
MVNIGEIKGEIVKSSDRRSSARRKRMIAESRWRVKRNPPTPS